MNKDFVPYNESLELKELGFNEPCLAFYEEDTNKLVTFHTDSYQEVTGHVCLGIQINVPTFSQVFRWFRDKYKLHSYISLGISNEQDMSELEYDEYTYVIEGLNGLDYDNYGEGLFSKTHEEAQLICLQQLIQIVKK
jgi:hypothetical protein